MLSGATRDALQNVVKRFAPRANLKPRQAMPGPEVRVLIATDVVSEGQNMQDCNRVLNYDLHWNPVRLIQRFGRVDRIGTTHETIYLHNTWPDTSVDAALTLTDRLKNRIQAFHDFIGLDTKLLSESERVNPAAMYRIYEQKRLPEQDDTLDEVAAHQRGIALLQNVQQNDPELWRTLGTLPDGLRSALPAPAPPAVDQAIVDFQLPFGRPTQLPLTVPREEAGIRSPLDDPGREETVVLLKAGERAMAYAVGPTLQPRVISPSQLLGAMECVPTTPAEPLPRDTNARVMAAYEAARRASATRIGRARRPGADTRLRRHLARQLKLVREAAAADPDELKRIGVLQQIFLDHLPQPALGELAEVRRMELSGFPLVRRLEALRERYRLNPPDAPAALAGDVEVTRIVCSDALV